VRGGRALAKAWICSPVSESAMLRDGCPRVYRALVMQIKYGVPKYDIRENVKNAKTSSLQRPVHLYLITRYKVHLSFPTSTSEITVVMLVVPGTGDMAVVTFYCFCSGMLQSRRQG
jgi:hypothetical protein